MPSDSRAGRGAGSWKDDFLTDQNVKMVRELNEVAQRRGQTLAQMAVSWVLRDPRMTTALIGASRPEQITELVKGLEAPPLTDEELADIDRISADGGVNIWKRSSTA